MLKQKMHLPIIRQKKYLLKLLMSSLGLLLPLFLINPSHAVTNAGDITFSEDTVLGQNGEFDFAGI